jgi:cytidine deaminase
MVDADTIEQLLASARHVRDAAYAPYSNYRVGAALLSRSGKIFVGCNVENATYGATICAERSAVVQMVAAGERDVVAVAVFSDGAPLAMPCGICRQVLVEFAGPDCIVLASSPATRQTTTLGALLPEPFTLRR